jgi:hypothetical protein
LPLSSFSGDPHPVTDIQFGVALKIIIHLCQCLKEYAVERIWTRMLALAKFSRNVRSSIFLVFNLLSSSSF